MVSNVKFTLDSLKSKLRKLSGYLLLFLAIIAAISLARSIIKIKQVNSKIIEKEEDVKKLSEENEELKRRLAIAKSSEFLEKQLRDKLGMSREGEIVLILPDDEILRKLAPKHVEEEETLPDPNWKKWAHLFGF